jgi:hypothetical protein
MSKIDANKFWNNWSGHPVKDVETVYEQLGTNKERVVWLVGDSSLDNKHWIFEELNNGKYKNINGYETLISPNVAVPDVAYHFNQLILDNGLNWLCINASIEESMLRQRQNQLLPHDLVVQKNIKQNDVLIVSVGGNDVAMMPTLQTIWAVFRSVMCSSLEKIQDGTAPGCEYLIKLFSVKVQEYIEKIIGDKKPSAVLVCMIYYPDTNWKISSWANFTLSVMGYNRNPAKLKALTSLIFEKATKQITIEGVKCIPIPLFEVMDGSDSSLYVARVEPSNEGGKKMAECFLNALQSEGITK